jgi:hypothetical protein
LLQKAGYCIFDVFVIMYSLSPGDAILAVLLALKGKRMTIPNHLDLPPRDSGIRN